MKFSTEDPAPAYLRFAVLDEFDEGSWKPGKRAIPVEQRADGELPPPVGLDPDVTSTQYEWHFEIDDGFKSGWLPLPFPALNVRVPGDWRYDLVDDGPGQRGRRARRQRGSSTTPSA